MGRPQKGKNFVMRRWKRTVHSYPAMFALGRDDLYPVTVVDLSAGGAKLSGLPPTLQLPLSGTLVSRQASRRLQQKNAEARDCAVVRHEQYAVAIKFIGPPRKLR
jgi:hypothetical protein